MPVGLQISLILPNFDPRLTLKNIMLKESTTAPLSVLMSVYAGNRPEHLCQSLDSVFGQSIKAQEVILVEDGLLKPELYDVIARFSTQHPELKIIKLKENVGLGRALNEGLKHCNNELVARMDADDICFPDRFEKQLKVFADHPKVSVVSGWVSEFNTSPATPTSIRYLPENHHDIYNYGRLRCPVNHPAAIYRKSAVIRVGGYPPKTLFEDYMLWVKLLINGERFYNVQEPVLHFRAGIDMYRRRGGFSYAVEEFQFQLDIHRLGYISLPRMLTNIAIRFTTRIIPLRLRASIYHRFLRRKD